MSRRRRAEKRKIEPDPVYGSTLVAQLINKVMLGGKKSTSRKIIYSALEKFAQKVKRQDDTLNAFEEALENAKPSLEVKSRRIGGATYQVPLEISPPRRTALAMRWIINYSRNKPGKPMDDALANELADCFDNQGSTIKKKDDTHRMAEANKAFAHYKW